MAKETPKMKAQAAKKPTIKQDVKSVGKFQSKMKALAPKDK